MRTTPTIAALLLLAGCAAPRAAPPVAPPPVPIPTPAPTPSAMPLPSDWNDWPYTPGDWRYLQQPGATIASFPTDAAPVTLTCDRFSRQIVLAGIGTTPVTIRTTTLNRTANPVADRAPTYGTVRFAASDPLLDAIAFSRGRFVIEQAGRPPLVLRPEAEIGRVIGDCRG